jgi:hypothetical protein
MNVMDKRKRKEERKTENRRKKIQRSREIDKRILQWQANKAVQGKKDRVKKDGEDTKER